MKNEIPKCYKLNNRCDIHKDGKYLRWSCGQKYNPQERRERYLKSKKPCNKCGKPTTATYCKRCFLENYVSPLKGKKLPEWWRDKIRNGQKLAEESPCWLGESATYWSKHKWLVRAFGHLPKCEHCGEIGYYNKGGKWSIHWANISGKYMRVREDYRGLCSKCHSVFDNKIKPDDFYNHGTVSRYTRGCKCTRCLGAKYLFRRGLIKFNQEVPTDYVLPKDFGQKNHKTFNIPK